METSRTRKLLAAIALAGALATGAVGIGGTALESAYAPSTPDNVPACTVARASVCDGSSYQEPSATGGGSGGGSTNPDPNDWP